MVRIFRWESVILEGITFSVPKNRFALFQLFVHMPGAGLGWAMEICFNVVVTVRNLKGRQGSLKKVRQLNL